MRKKIIIVTNSFPYGKGEQFIFDELNIISNFHDITIIPLFSNQREKSFLLSEDISVFNPICAFDIKNKKKLILKGLFNFGPLLFLFKEFFSKKLFINFNNIVSWATATFISRIVFSFFTKKEVLNELLKADILYFYWSDSAANSIQLLKNKLKDVKVLVRFHGSDLYENIRNNYIPYRRCLLQNIDFALFVSEHGAKYLMDKYNNINIKTKIFRLGAYNYGLSNESNDGILRLVSCSFMVPVKRIEIIISALRKIKDIKIEWTHLGDGPLRKVIYDVSLSLPQNVNFELRGSLSRDDLMKFYKNNPIDLFINVSRSEGVPVSIMEVLSFGIPVIATNVGGTSEIINNDLGYIVNENITPNDLALIIENFYHREDKNILKLNARKMYEEKCDATINFSKFNSFLENIHDI